jgi:diguanylate cyclase (GGDEF)-like protein/PAS domain S-box-containing protein
LVLDEERNIRFASTSVLAITGYRAEDLIGTSVRNLVHADDQEQLAAVVLHFTEGGGHAEVEVRVLFADGVWHWVHETITDLRDDPLIRGFVINARDITEDRVSRELLRESEQRYRTIVDTAEEGIWIADLEAVITFANPAMARIVGVAGPDDLVGRSVFDVVGQSFRDELRQKLNDRQEGHSEVYEIPATRLDGLDIWIHVASTPLRDAAGQVSGVLAVVSDVTERHRADEQTRFQARHDRLTELPNRAHLIEHLSGLLSQENNAASPFALLLIGIDRFREINDISHEAGDEILVALARRLASNIRATDFVARLGGDTFAVVALGVATPAAAGAVAESLMVAVNDPVTVGGLEVAVTVRAGVVHAPTQGEDLKTLFRRAEVAMRQAKQAEGGWSLYDASRDAHRPDRLALTGDLGRAIESGDLTLHYQPQVDLATGRIVGVEALARWMHPTRGNIPPVEFVPLAERTGLALPLATWALRTALSQCAQWCREGLEIPVSVNVTPTVVHHNALFATVTELLLATGVPARFLTLELTEGAVAEPTSAFLEALTRLRHLGIRISVDDFGIGYSAMSYLLHFPLDELKIDKLFVQKILEDKRAWQIVTAIVGVGRSLDLRVVAEGIEADEEGARLATLGCVGQGYAICRPAPATDITGWCLRHIAASNDILSVGNPITPAERSRIGR